MEWRDRKYLLPVNESEWSTAGEKERKRSLQLEKQEIGGVSRLAEGRGGWKQGKQPANGEVD